MKFYITINHDSPTDSFTVATNSGATVLISRSNLDLSGGIALLELNPFQVLFLRQLDDSFEIEVPEHVAFSISGLLEHSALNASTSLAQKSTPFGRSLPNLVDYSDLIFHGAERAAKVLDGSAVEDLACRYVRSEEAFLKWRSEMLAGVQPSKPRVQTPWRLLIHRPAEEFGYYTAEIHLDNHIIQGGVVETILPLMQTLGIDCEYFDDDWPAIIEIPVPQHRALLLVYLLEHAKRIRPNDCPMDWGDTSELLYEAMREQSPLYVFREALRITDSALEASSHDYSFAPFNYDLCESLMEQLMAQFDKQSATKGRRLPRIEIIPRKPGRICR